ncbi:5-oxoprolinase/urea amidolyase family protein [Pseudarthrobacter phenanthrenivorans]|uniref:5-oxoprolinase/urea amidolyase family protein n=1 Tax=Pseudarthrobacter phenanthrenivorans TaxID=361575 RepID=A0A3B0G1R8_PSEPS|nr:5-oxoprolinase/urea amidolyase family protein [Pseudarthrobacter phenanthrenivorans]RKO24527.1 5-oxoprolinase/urea amidolyase family protein [Pseudarthrobacter phenanthrenivorans]
MTAPGIRWAGPRALLVELDSLEAVLALHARLVEKPAPGQVDVLAAAQTVLAVFDSRATARAARELITRLDAEPARAAATPSAPVQIEVVYDGEDLAEVARLTGMGTDSVVAAHTGQLWTAAFGGFAPGFAYLVGETDALNVPRRGTPRTAVPAGSVALAGNFSAVYPRRSPGGWQLIGHTAARMWDLEREQPALVRPGTRVQYVAVRELVDISSAGGGPAGGRHLEGRQQDGKHRAASSQHKAAISAGHSLEVLAPGPQALVQDLGRPGLGDLGVSGAGAADTASARQANRLVGNLPTDAVIENVLGGLAVRAKGELTAALSGAATEAEIRSQDGTRPAPMYAPFPLHDDESLHLGTPEAGLRTYLAVRGGIDVPPVLGSRSTDLMSGIGPAPLAAGTVLPIGAIDTARAVGQPEPPTLPKELGSAAAGKPVVLRITTGPRHDWFTPESRQALTGQEWTVTAESNRIGVRLDVGSDGSGAPGKALERARTGELPSEGVVAGSLQVPPSGLPVLFLADHPVTGGYPVIGAVIPEDLPAAAQLPPGTTVRFVDVDPETLQPLAPPPSP